jgi:DnaA family protein
MTQLLLDITPDWQPSFDNFVTGANQELLSVLHQVLSGEGRPCSIYLWGAAGSGKSHLLQASVNAAKISQDSAVYARDKVPPAQDVVAFDDVQRLNDAAQIELFYLYNMMREIDGLLLVSGNCSLRNLDIRPDLRTRLGWGLVYQVQALSDEEKTLALMQHAQCRGFKLAPEIAQFLLRHGQRDLPGLLAVLNALDEQSLRLHRAPSIPMLKDILNLSLKS